MENALLAKLSGITRTLLDLTRPAYSLRGEVLELKKIFESASGWSTDLAIDIGSGETLTSSGVAISPTMAAMCVDDFARTVQFIRGLHDAISDKARRPVRVLYAGCGPWATLAVPLMSVYRPDDVNFILLDIHDESIELARRVIQKLGLSRYVEEFVVADALTYEIDQSTPPEIIVVEMLRAALADEPQVAVAENLILQFPSALMIPESVRIDLALVDRSKEFGADRDRIDLGAALVLDGSGLKTHQVTIPDHDDERYTPMLLTAICVYGEHILRDYDSGITCPRPFKLDGGPGAVEFFYETGKSPRLSARRVS